MNRWIPLLDEPGDLLLVKHLFIFCVFNKQFPEITAFIMRRFKGENDVEETYELVRKVLYVVSAGAQKETRSKSC